MNIENITAIQNRMSQIQSMIQGRTSNMCSRTQSTQINFQEMMKTHMTECNPAADAQKPSPSAGVANLKTLSQSNSVSCGQTSVAMAINSLTGKSLTDMDIDQKYGFGLLNALNSETQNIGVNWKDGGTVNADSWKLIEQKVNQEQTPVIVAMNGPEFSPSGRGHIVTITKVEGDTVYYADPAHGTVRTTTKDAMNNAPSHPDGNFIFYADREGGGTPMAMNTMSMLPFLNKAFRP